MNCKEHLTIEGINKIVAIKASLNLGLSAGLKAAFPSLVAIDRPLVQNQKIHDANWLAGFASGEGCFLVRIKNSPRNRIGFQVLLAFKLVQHTRDELLMRSLIDYFGCGKAYKDRESVQFIITKYGDLIEKVIPFFDKYQIEGVKSLDLADFKRVAAIMKVNGHTTESGLEEIRLIKAGMNRGRS